jgi:hypothetical protein
MSKAQIVREAYVRAWTIRRPSPVNWPTRRAAPAACVILQVTAGRLCFFKDSDPARYRLLQGKIEKIA